jgi:GT2 family glycosyltransferase
MSAHVEWDIPGSSVVRLKGPSQMAVAIINYNTRQHLRACLESVHLDQPSEVIVVDNASTDGSAEMVQAEFPDVQLIARQDNPGYGAASNEAIAASRSEIILLLNSDTRLRPGGLDSLADFLDQHPRTAVLGPRLLNIDGSLQHSCFPWPGARVVLFEELIGSARLAGLPVVREQFLRTWAHDRPRKVPWVLGAALAIRRDAFQQVGGFDPAFFMYFEETDLCRRMWDEGWEVHFSPAAEIEHLGGASTSQKRTEMYARLYQSMSQFVRKHDGSGAERRLRAVIRSVMTLRLARERFRSNPEPDAAEAARRWQAVLDAI